MTHYLLKKYTFRKDHYDGINALYRLSAVMSLESTSNESSITEQIQQLILKVKTWSVVPNEIVVFPNRAELHWYTIGFQMSMNQEQYLNLIQQFLSFLNNIPEMDVQFLERCLIEDPERLVWSVPNQMINFLPEFTSECFGSKGQEIKVLILNERLEVVA